jgi:hypothetical protein
MGDEKLSSDRSVRVEEPTNDSRRKISAAQMAEILARARQNVKPIINRESATEIVNDEILNFRMKS